MKVRMKFGSSYEFEVEGDTNFVAFAARHFRAMVLADVLTPLILAKNRGVILLKHSDVRLLPQLLKRESGKVKGSPSLR